MLEAFIDTADAPTQQAIVQIWGIAYEDLSQANNFTGCLIEVRAGFQKGLPLNNPKQAGLILKGEINQAFGNWQGTDMTLDFVVSGAGGTLDHPVNIPFDWQAGTTLATALATTFTTAFPGEQQDIQISNSLVLNHDEVGTYDTIASFAQMLRDITRPILGGTYDGVTITMLPTGVKVRDSYKAPAQATAATTSSASTAVVNGQTVASPDFSITAPAAAKPSAATPVTQLAFQDLMGQPTWLDAYTITFACPMRADLVVGSVVQMPPGIIGGSAGPGSPGTVSVGINSKPSAREKVFFSGKFEIYQVRHLGNFRQPDGQSWVTVFRGSPAGASS